ncbi:hypothetical protein [Deinococcus maricopensis]|uniref:hypothetical protein n=1 Tax=Deinococcus maricopensis TaxID=309887 RepID=UPI0011D1E8E0|nr:hypothetical protein [Deinococcus maricopensis]
MKKTIPEALAEPRFACFLDYLLFSRFLDEDTNYRVCPEHLLADMEDLSHKLDGKSRNYNRATIFPKEFEEATGLHLLSQGYRFKDGRASAYEIEIIPEPLKNALQLELLHPPTDKSQGVYLERGKPLSLSERQDKKRTFIERKENYMSRTDVPRPDVFYLNASSRTSTFLNRQHNARQKAAESAIEALPIYDADGKAKRGYVSQMLSYLPDTFEPFYEAKGDTHRIYTNGTSLQNLPSTVRKAILAPSKNYDLKAAQLAIMAKHWEVSELQALLENGEVWNTLCLSLGVPIGEKGKIKRLVYSTAFGMSPDNLAILYGQALGQLNSDATKNRPDEKARAHYLNLLESNKYLGALLQGRKRAAKRISSTKTARDADGKEHKPRDFSKSMVGGGKYRSMLAFEMQSREKWLMQPVIDFAQENEGKMLITLWLHDGVYIHFFKDDRSGKLEKEMIRRVNARAEEAGYATSLVLDA